LVHDAAREVVEGALVLDLVAAVAELAAEDEVAAVVAIVEGEGEGASGSGGGVVVVEVVAVATGDEADGEEEREEEGKSERHDRSGWCGSRAESRRRRARGNALARSSRK